jgi:hypothetical protein
MGVAGYLGSQKGISVNELPFSSVPKVGILPRQRLHDVGRMIR